MQRMASSAGSADQLGTLINTLNSDPKKMGANAGFPNMTNAINPNPAAGQTGDDVDPRIRNQSPKTDNKR